MLTSRRGLVLVGVAALAATPQVGYAQALRSGSVEYEAELPLEVSAEKRSVKLEWIGGDYVKVVRWPRHTSQIAALGKFSVEGTDGQDAYVIRMRSPALTVGELRRDINLFGPSPLLGQIPAGFVAQRDGRNRLTSLASKGTGAEWTYEWPEGASPAYLAKYRQGGGALAVDYRVLRREIPARGRRSLSVPKWFAPGKLVVDTRVDPPVNWTYEELVEASGKKSGLTLDALLELSRRRAGGIAKKRSDRAPVASQRGAAWHGPAMIFGIVSALGLLGYALSRRMAQRRSGL